MNIWNFQRGGVLNQKPSMRGVWIFHEIIPFGTVSQTLVAGFLFLCTIPCRIYIFLNNFPFQEFFFGKSHPPPVFSNGPPFRRKMFLRTRAMLVSIVTSVRMGN